MPEYTLTHAVVYTYSNCDINVVMPWHTLTHLTLTQLLFLHVTVYLFRTLLPLIFDCIFDICCRLLIRIMLLIHFTCTYNRFHRVFFLILSFADICCLSTPVIYWFMLHEIHGMCLVVTKTLLPAVFFLTPSRSWKK